MPGGKIRSSLEFLGLSEKESSIYLFVCSNPKTTAGQIIKTLKIARSKTYDGLQKLTSMGLVNKSGRGVAKYCSAGWPILAKVYEDKIAEVGQAIAYLIGGMGGISVI